MAKNIPDEKFYSDSRKLGLAIYAFLLDERFKKRRTEKARLNIAKAAECLRTVFKFRFADHAMIKMTRPLQDIFAIGHQPVPVKNRIAAESHRRQGNNFFEAEMFQLAEAEFTTAINLDPRNAILYCDRAASRIRLRSLASAVEDCNRALELDNNYAKAFCCLGLAYTLMNRPALAIRYFRKTLRIEPNNPACVAYLEWVSKKVNHEAFRVFEPLPQRNRILTVNAARNQELLQKKSSGDHVEANMSKSGNLQTEKIALDDKSEAGMLVIKKH